MVRTKPTYDPPLHFEGGPSSLIYFNLRILDRYGEVVVDFDEFQDLLSYNDQISVESPAGSWTLKMRALTSNRELLQRIHPGLVVEVYACRNDDPLTGVGAFVPQTEEENPPVFTEGESLLSEPYAPVDGRPAPPPEPELPDYLDLAPYLIMRGITSSYGRNSAVSEGGSETTLTLSGESYGAVYRNCSVLVDRNAPTALGKELQTRLNTQNVHNIVPLYYGILRHWVEEFWGEETGWEARTRPIPVPPDAMARVNEGSVWSVLQGLSCDGLFHLFVDHTGALCWEKLPWSGRCQNLIDEFMDWQGEGYQFRNWEDLPLVEVPSSWIMSWADRLSCDRLSNYLRVQITQYGGAGGSGSNMDAGQVYNMGSIRQYGGPRRMEVQIPAGVVPFATLGEVERTEAESRVTQFVDRAAMELIRWYDRPVQRLILSLRGDSGWRINTRISITEDWHDLDAEPAEYYVLSRSHSIELAQGRWTTQLECLRDRRTRYLGFGIPPVLPSELGAIDGILAPTEPDEYWWFNREIGSIEWIGEDGYEAFIAEQGWLPEGCELEEEEESEEGEEGAGNED